VMIVRCSVLQCIAVCCSVLQCVTVYCSVLQWLSARHSLLGEDRTTSEINCACTMCVAVYYSVLQCVTVCCSVLQYVAACCSVLQCVAVCRSMLQRVAVCRTSEISSACMCAVAFNTHTSSRAHIDAFRSRRNAAHLRSTVYMCPFIHVFHSCCCVKFAHESSRTGKRSWDLPSCHLLDKQIPSCGNRCTYGVATVSRIDKIIGIFCRILSLLWGSFAKET